MTFFKKGDRFSFKDRIHWDLMSGVVLLRWDKLKLELKIRFGERNGIFLLKLSAVNSPRHNLLVCGPSFDHFSALACGNYNYLLEITRNYWLVAIYEALFHINHFNRYLMNNFFNNYSSLILRFSQFLRKTSTMHKKNSR